MATRYKVAYPFSNGDYYIEIRDGKRFIDWLKVGAVPGDLRHLIIKDRHSSESVSCKTRKDAQLLAQRMTERLP